MENIINEEQLEKMRRKAKKFDKIVTIMSVISFPIYAWIFYVIMVQKEKLCVLFIAKLITVSAILSIGTFMLLWIIIIKNIYDKFNETFKSKYVLQTINKINGFDDLRYYQKNGFSWDDIRNMTVVDCGDKKYFENEDLLFGVYENVRFKISDVTTKKIVHRNNKKRIKEIFSGQVLCLFQFDDIKISNGYLQIFEKEFLFSMGGWKAEHKIHTENETFNKRFSVYASDEHNAYYILTPQRIEKIMYFADIVNGQISLVFYDKNLFVAVRGESMFDANINEPVVNQTTKITKDAKFIQVAKEILIEK